MVACVPCAAWLKLQPGVCEGRAFCSEDNDWTRGDLTTVDDDGHRRDLCPGCLKAYRRAIDDEGRGDYLRDCAKDEAVRS